MAAVRRVRRVSGEIMGGCRMTLSSLIREWSKDFFEPGVFGLVMVVVSIVSEPDEDGLGIRSSGVAGVVPSSAVVVIGIRLMRSLSFCSPNKIM